MDKSRKQLSNSEQNLLQHQQQVPQSRLGNIIVIYKTKTCVNQRGELAAYDRAVSILVIRQKGLYYAHSESHGHQNRYKIGLSRELQRYYNANVSKRVPIARFSLSGYQ